MQHAFIAKTVAMATVLMDTATKRKEISVDGQMLLAISLNSYNIIIIKP